MKTWACRNSLSSSSLPAAKTGPTAMLAFLALMSIAYLLLLSTSTSNNNHTVLSSAGSISEKSQRQRRGVENEGATSIVTQLKENKESAVSALHKEDEGDSKFVEIEENQESAVLEASIPYLANLTLQDINDRGSRLARAFVPWSDSHEDSWCIIESCGRRIRNGLLYTKVPKTASSTLESIAIRVLKQYGRDGQWCCGIHSHNNANRTYGNRRKEQSYLWSMIRDPASRALSRIFFTTVSSHRKEPTDKLVISQLKTSNNPQFGTISHGQGGFQMRYLSLEIIEEGSAWNKKARTVVLQPERVERVAQKILQDYDFLTVIERLDESIVALQLLLGLETGDVLTLSSKRAGQYHYFKERKACVKLQKSFVSPAVKEYLSSQEWIAQNYGDYLLYAAANRSLDLTIERIGQPRFETALARYRELMALVDQECSASAVFPCSEDGQAQFKESNKNCYVQDKGCGYPCIDRIWAQQKHANST